MKDLSFESTIATCRASDSGTPLGDHAVLTRIL